MHKLIKPIEQQFLHFCKEKDITINDNALRQFANDKSQQGLFSEAILALEALIAADNHNQLKDILNLNHNYFVTKQYKLSITLLENALKIYPDTFAVLYNLALTHLYLKSYQEAIFYYEKCLKIKADSIDAYDGLNIAYHYLGQKKLAQKYGKIALDLKSQQACADTNIQVLQTLTNIPLPLKSPLPKFNENNKNKNIIAFSLWGNNPTYLKNAIVNAMFNQLIMRSWTCRFYYDESVPDTVIQQLTANNAQVCLKPKNKTFEGLFWRFEVIQDPNVEYFLIRDCDSLISLRERAAISQWLLSKKPFHIIRDHSLHTELILAGLWGGIVNAIPSMEKLITHFIREKNLLNRVSDQHFLRTYIWPLIHEHAFIHDTFYAFGKNTHKIPEVAHIPETFPYIGAGLS